jgi:hypothetical protein
MAISKCISCETKGRFEEVDFVALGLKFIQCGNCGGVVGVKDLGMQQAIQKLTEEVRKKLA